MNQPQTGEYYYHYKHDPEKDVLNYAYTIVGIAVHSETEELLVAYAPLYSGNHVEELGGDFYVRPLQMFMEHVDKPEYQGPRFTKMTEQQIEAVLAALENKINT